MKTLMRLGIGLLLLIFGVPQIGVQPIPGNAQAPNLPILPTISFEEIVTNLVQPVFVTHAGDGSGRLFILEQRGVILIYQNGLQQQPFLDINGRVRSSADGGDAGSEEGLLGLAFPPGFGVERSHFYVYYTNLDGNNQVSRFRLSSNPDTADSSSEERILLLPHPSYTNHNGGMITFGPDGYLYVGPGDGGGGGDPFNNAQNPASLLGKILRIDVELQGQPTAGLDHQIFLPISINQGGSAPAYSIPADNPFVSAADYRPEIWALGLRNPWRFSFDRQTHDLFIADVGQAEWEEVNFQPAASGGGENYGWDRWEGETCYTAPCSPTGMTMPFETYEHLDGNCSITGGYIYRGADHPNLEGIYFYSDYCTGQTWGTRYNGSAWETEILDQDDPALAFSISSFGEDETGEIYAVDRGGSTGGRLLRLTTP